MEKYVFVYGTLKEGERNHHFLGKSEKIGEFYTEPIYSMVKAGSYPIVKREGHTAIEGELYKVTNEETLRGIYMLEGYTGRPGALHNYYDIDKINVGGKDAIIFVMDKIAFEKLPAIESGIFSHLFK